MSEHPLPNTLLETVGERFGIKRHHWKYLLATLYLIPAIPLLYFFHAHGLSGDALLAYADEAKIYATSHPVAALVLFFFVYLVTVVYSLPTTVALNLLAGYLFGAVSGALIASLSCTAGAYLLYRLYACLFADCRFARKHPPIPQRPFWVILLLRLSPVFPAPLINAAAGIYRIHRPTFILATFAGSLPLIYAYAAVGGSLEHMHSVTDILSSETLLLFSVLTGLTLLAMFNPSSDSIRRVATQALRQTGPAATAK